MKKTISIQCASVRISSRRMIFVFAILLFVAPSILHAEIQTGSFDFDGRLRDYMVYLPNSYTGSVDFPLVIHLHSGGWTAQQDMDYIKLNQVADTSGFIVVYPSAIDKRWHIEGSPAPNPDVNDVGFINALIDIMSNSYSIDLERIYACGYSRGGFMAYTLACQLSHRIAAIASVAGLLPTSTAESCSPLHTMPVLHIHGTADTWVPINGISGVYSADQTISYWTSFNDCGEVDTTTLPDLDPADGCTVEKTTYTLCSDNCRVVYYKVINGGHTWPGAGPPGYAAGNTTQDINASEEIWNFFNSHKLVTIPVVDFNGDGTVDFNDFAVFAQSAYDDGELDAEALAAFAASWLWKATEEAWGPNPEDGAIDVVIDSQITLSWNLGEALDIENRTVSYAVYFGTDPDALAERDTVEQTSYDFTGRFMPLTTYYWRIDTNAKLNRPPFDTIVIPGNIWSFTMEP